MCTNVFLYVANYPTANLTNVDDRKRWIQIQLQIVQDNYLDGINFDFDDAIPKDRTELRDGYTALVRDTFTAFKNQSQKYQVPYAFPSMPVRTAEA